MNDHLTGLQSLRLLTAHTSICNAIELTTEPAVREQLMAARAELEAYGRALNSAQRGGK